jgi:hypothetical protein
MKQSHLVRAGLLVVALMGGQSAVAQGLAAKAAAPNHAGSAAAEGLQPKRLALINDLIAKGVFQKVEKPRELPYLWVRPGFYALDLDMKQRFVGVVYMYFKTEDPAVRLIVLYDSRTGKRAGRFSEDLGGLDME